MDECVDSMKLCSPQLFHFSCFFFKFTFPVNFYHGKCWHTLIKVNASYYEENMIFESACTKTQVYRKA